jgi:hypothetical protein
MAARLVNPCHQTPFLPNRQLQEVSDTIVHLFFTHFWRLLSEGVIKETDESEKTVPANCSTQFFDPVQNRCLCQSSSCAFVDQTKPIGPNGQPVAQVCSYSLVLCIYFVSLTDPDAAGDSSVNREGLDLTVFHPRRLALPHSGASPPESVMTLSVYMLASWSPSVFR